MKKTTFFKMLLVMAGLLVGGSAWADDITSVNDVTYDYSTEGASTAPFDENAIVTNGGGNVTALTLPQAGTTTANFETPYSIQSNEKVTFTFTVYLGWAYNGPDQSIAILNDGDHTLASFIYNNGSCAITDVKIGDETPSSFATIGDFNNQNGFTSSKSQDWWTIDGAVTISVEISGSKNVTMTFNNPKKSISKSIIGSIGADIDLNLSKIVLTHGSKNYVYGRAIAIKSLVLASEISTVQQYSYIVNYVDKNNDNTVIKSEIGMGEAGSTVTVSKVDFWQNDKKYKYVSDNSAEKQLNADDTEITVLCEEVPKYNYTVNAVDASSNLLKQLISGSEYDGEVVSGIPFNKYYLGDDNVLLEASAINGGYNCTFTINGADVLQTIKYETTNINDVIFYSEAEDLTGVQVISSGQLYNVGSGMKGAATNANNVSGAVDVTVLPAGKYKVVAFYGGKSDQAIAKVNAGEQEVLSMVTNATITQFNSEEFSLTKPTIITFDGGWATTTANAYGLDLIYIQKTGDIKTLTAEYGTYYSDRALDFSETGLTAYIATACDGKTVTLKEVTSVPAYTGVLLKGEADTYEIPAATDETDDEQGIFEGVITETEVSESIYVLYDGDDGVGFYQTKADKFTVSANTAYLPVVAGGTSKLRFVVEEGEATAISGIATEKAENGATYNVAGQLVNDNYKGIVIKNGKKYFNK